MGKRLFDKSNNNGGSFLHSSIAPGETEAWIEEIALFLSFSFSLHIIPVDKPFSTNGSNMKRQSHNPDSV